MWGQFLSASKAHMINEDEALAGRATPVEPGSRHRVLGNPMQPPFPAGHQTLVLGMGCFWGAEQCFWSLPGVWTTAVGYAGGYTPNPLYEEVCSGRTGHTEAVLVVYDPESVSLETLLQVFWEAHDPTQGMAQGNDRGTQYRSALYLPDGELLGAAQASAQGFQQALTQAGKGSITTEIRQQVPFFYAEDYHQQYLDRNPNGYCGLAGTGVAYQKGQTAGA
ncbi:MAG: peptide-methionine (S)-S-oxide reductase MsrA [Halomonadaceae bacterium]|nr:MAG: peptide-methionine (S)-S-oxide reductase MsrA [Halomonadaceae bacterium]